MGTNTAFRIDKGVSLEDAFLKDGKAVIESLKKEEKNNKENKEEIEI